MLETDFTKPQTKMVTPQTDLRKFVETTELGESSFKRDPGSFAGKAAIAMSTEDEQGFLSNHSVVSFAAGVPAAKRWDVLDAVLFAQLAADKKFDLHKDTFDWYTRYHEVLRTIGWVTETNLFANKELSNSVMEVKDEIISILSAAFGGVAIAPLVLKVLESIKDLGDDDGNIIAFKKSIQKDEKGAFQVAFAQETGGLVTMLSGIFKVTATSQFNQFLFFKSSKDFTGVSYNVSKNTLQEAAYAGIRELVVSKLGQNRQKATMEIELA